MNFEIFLNLFKIEDKKNGGQNFQCVKGLPKQSDKETSVAFQTTTFHWNVGGMPSGFFLVKKILPSSVTPPRSCIHE